MSDPHKEIITSIVSGRWPATHTILDIRYTNGYWRISAFGRSWCSDYFRFIMESGDQLFDIMDQFEKYYPKLTTERFPSSLGCPYISANFRVNISKEISAHPERRTRMFLSIRIGDLDVSLGNFCIGKRNQKIDQLEQFLAQLAEKRAAIRPLPLPIRDAINWHF